MKTEAEPGVAATSQGMTGVTRGWERQEGEPPLEFLEEARPCRHLDFRFVASRAGRESISVRSHPPVVLCYSVPGKFIPVPNLAPEETRAPHSPACSSLPLVVSGARPQWTVPQRFWTAKAASLILRSAHTWPQMGGLVSTSPPAGPAPASGVAQPPGAPASALAACVQQPLGPAVPRRPWAL